MRRLFWSIPSYFVTITVEMCAAAKNCGKFTVNRLLGSSRSFKVIDIDKSKKPVTSVCYNMQQVCTHLQPFSHCANSGKITYFRGYSCLTPSFLGSPLTQGHEILSR